MAALVEFEGGEIILYESPLDYHSQCARMLLIEKGVKYTSKPVDEEKLENLEEWYLKLNPKATLPALVCGGTVVSEPRKIVEWIQELPIGRVPLKPPPESYMLKRYDELMDEHYEMDVVSYTLLYRVEVCGWSKEGSMLKITQHIFDGIKKLTAAVEKCADRELKAAMAALINQKRKTLHDMKYSDELFNEHMMHFYGAFDALEGVMETNECANMWDSWMCGPDEASYTVCDILWTCLLARCWWCKFTRRNMQARPRCWQYWKRVKSRDVFTQVFPDYVLGPPLFDEEAELRGDVLENELKDRPMGGYVVPGWTSQLAPHRYHQWHFYKVFTKVATVREGPDLKSPVVGEVACKTVVCATGEFVIPVDPKSWETTPIRLYIDKPVAGWISTKAVKDLETWDDLQEPGPFEGSEYFNDIQGWLDKHRIKKAYDARRNMGYKYYQKSLEEKGLTRIPNYHQFGKYSGIKVDPIPQSKYVK